MLGRRPPPPADQEGVGAEEDRRLQLLHQLRDDPVVQRRGMQAGADAGGQRQHDPRREAEAVEERQRRDRPVGRPDRRARLELGDVGEEVAMRQHDPLRRPLGARGEEHRRLGVTPEVARAEPRRDERGQLVEDGDRRLEILGPENAEARRLDRCHQIAEAALLDERAAGDHGRASGGPQRRERPAPVPAVELSIAGTRPARQKRHEHGDGPRRRGQQQAHPLAGREPRPQRAFQHGARERELAVGQGVALDVLEGDAVGPMRPARREDCIRERTEAEESPEAIDFAVFQCRRPPWQPLPDCAPKRRVLKSRHEAVQYGRPT